MDDWAINTDDKTQAGSIERVTVDSGAPVSLCALGCAPEIPIADSLFAERDHKNHIQRSDRTQHGEGGSVNVNFQVADVTRQLVAVGLTRGENCTKVLAPILVQGTPMPVTKVTSELSSVEDTIDTMRDEAEAQIRAAVSTPTEPGAVERSRHDLTHSQALRTWWCPALRLRPSRTIPE